MFATSLNSSVRVGMEMLRANPLRSVLSTLGVIMGVASLVGVLALGDGLEQFGRSMIENEGMQLVSVSAKTTRELDGVTVNRDSFPTFASTDAAALEAALPAGSEVGMTIDGPATVQGPRGAPRGAYLTGLLPMPALTESRPLIAGRYFSVAEVRAGAAVIVLSHDLAAALAAPDSAATMLGGTVTVAGRRLQVVGIQQAVPRRGAAAPFTAVVPVDSAAALMLPSARPRVPQLIARAARIEAVDSLKTAAERWAATRWPDWKREVSISAARAERLEQLKSGVLIFKIAMGAFTSISLIVGGIGIMNVLLAAVTERTREIGIRKTVGARHVDIMTQFLAESVVVTGVGSIIGAVIGLVGAFGVTALMRAQTRMQVYAGFSWQTLLVAALASVTVGLVFGTYPARRAARLSPIEAIRHE